MLCCSGVPVIEAKCVCRVWNLKQLPDIYIYFILFLKNWCCTEMGSNSGAHLDRCTPLWDSRTEVKRGNMNHKSLSDL